MSTSPPNNTTALRIIGGRVIDPANGIDAVRDVLIHEGRVVETLPDNVHPRTIDATNKLVLPGAIEMHTHIASRGVAIAHELDAQLVPAPRETALAYLQMGYTTLIDAAAPRKMQTSPMTCSTPCRWLIRAFCWNWARTTR